MDRPAITCDIIVGFPGETDDDFAETVEFSKWAGFSKIHVFPFSVRTGTPAAKLKNRLPADVIKSRAQTLRNLSDTLGHKFVEQFVGQTCEVLIEDNKRLAERAILYGFSCHEDTKTRNPTTDYTDFTDSLATEIISHRGNRNIEKK